MSPPSHRTHEVTFCSRVAGWLNALFAEHPEWPFRRAEIEESMAIRRKRSDLRIYGDGNTLIVAGEVKLPGTPQGRTAYGADLVEDAAQKADSAGAEFFFTWNVNELVLFDRKKWQLRLMDRRVQEFRLGLDLQQPEDVSRFDVETRLREFMGECMARFATIVTGEQTDWAMQLDVWFIKSFERHILWPVRIAVEEMGRRAESDRAFDARLQEWIAQQGWMYLRNDPEEWRNILDRAARTLCYVFANRLIFYESCRAKFDELRPLSMPARLTTAGELYEHFQKTFQLAVAATGDYETLFYPYEREWAGPLIFAGAEALEGWRSIIRNLEFFDFKSIRSDVLGGIFQRLIDPDERHRFGQHYTNEDLVDVVNSFCIRHAEDNVLDPACGSGSFLVRAYHRKAWLREDRRRTHASIAHQHLLSQVYGADISLFAAHLATLNLASRDINDEENYPRIRRGNFFEVAAEVAKKKPFCLLPQGLRGERIPGPVGLPPLQAIVGNPPYVRQELIPRRGQQGVKPMQAKEDLLDLCANFWPGLKLSGRSDLHCYFWPGAAHFLEEGGWFGFLVSSSWLDVEYGFALQEWVLSNFRIHAILESNAEPWFEDARVKTCAVILQRCASVAARAAQLVRFVRLDLPLNDILGKRADENARQIAADRFRDTILAARKNGRHDGWRVVVRKQSALWEDGIRAGRLFDMQKRREQDDRVAAPSGGGDDEEDGGHFDENGNGVLHEPDSLYGVRYGGGKWGKYLRAPDLYFRIMEDYRDRFVPLGEIASIRFGVKSGCDAFFMPRDVSAAFLAKYAKQNWNEAPLMAHCKRAEVESGKVRLVEDGDGVVHPVESSFLAPEVHSLMNVSRPQVLAAHLDRLVLLVAGTMADLKGTHVLKYLRYGETKTFASKKSKAVPVPLRTSCASRTPWYDLTGSKPGAFFWPMAQQYRHIVPANREGLICNHNLFDVHPCELTQEQIQVLQAVANSTLIANFKTFYGRYAGTEGNLKTEVIDVNLLEVPDPRRATPELAQKFRVAFDALCQRDTGPLVEEVFMQCRSSERAQKLAQAPVGLPLELQQPDRRALDLAVFELLGVKTVAERESLCDELYRETAAHFRQVRVVEIQKQEQRTGGGERNFRAEDLCADLWDALSDGERVSLADWLAGVVAKGRAVEIPEGVATLPDADDLLDATTVFFRPPGGAKSASIPVPLPSRSHAEIVFALSRAGLHGVVHLPGDASAAKNVNERLAERIGRLKERARELARSRAGDERKIEDLAALLTRWMLHGKPEKPTNARGANMQEYV